MFRSTGGVTAVVGSLRRDTCEVFLSLDILPVYDPH